MECLGRLEIQCEGTKLVGARDRLLDMACKEESQKALSQTRVYYQFTGIWFVAMFGEAIGY